MSSPNPDNYARSGNCGPTGCTATAYACDDAPPPPGIQQQLTELNDDVTVLQTRTNTLTNDLSNVSYTINGRLGPINAQSSISTALYGAYISTEEGGYIQTGKNAYISTAGLRSGYIDASGTGAGTAGYIDVSGGANTNSGYIKTKGGGYIDTSGGGNIRLLGGSITTGSDGAISTSGTRGYITTGFGGYITTGSEAYIKTGDYGTIETESYGRLLVKGFTTVTLGVGTGGRTISIQGGMTLNPSSTIAIASNTQLDLGDSGYVKTSSGGSIDTTGQGSIKLGTSGIRTTLNGSASSNRTMTFADAGGTLCPILRLSASPPASVFTSIPANGGIKDVAYPFPGVQIGDPVFFTSTSLRTGIDQNLIFEAIVYQNDSVTIRAHNPTTSAIPSTSAFTFKVIAFKGVPV
jgi:hypothetical protein